jgi:hypothetical protein
VPGAELALGDALLAEGALDVTAHAHAVVRGEETAGVPIGSWLIERGMTSRPALEAALRRQLRARVTQLFSCERIEYRFETSAPEHDLHCVAEPIASVDLVLCAMRARVHDWPESHALSVLKSPALQLNAAGSAFLRATLWPDEAVVIHLLERGTTLRELRAATGGSLRALRFLAVLALLGASGTREAPYALLLRKRAQLRQGEGARALLDLPRSADASDARRALRRLARRVHPDALGPSASEALRRASNEVMSALIDAELAVRRAAASER